MTWQQAAPRVSPWMPTAAPALPPSVARPTSTEPLLVVDSEGTLSSSQSSAETALSRGFENGPVFHLACAGIAVVVAAVLGSALMLLALSIARDPADATGAIIPPLRTPGIKVPSGGGRPTGPTIATTPGPLARQAKVFTRGKLYYRSAYLDEAGGYLFVGAMDQLFKLQLGDISLEPVTSLHLPAPEQSISSCTVRGGDQLGTAIDCRNHIREIHPIGKGSTLYVCGTNSRSPTDWQVQTADLSMVPEEKRVPVMESNQTGKAEGRCSDFVSRDTSSLWLDDAPKPGTSSVVSVWQLTQGRHSIYRAAIPAPGTDRPLYSYLKTDEADTAALSEPHTTGALSFGAHAYFVFRENAAERRACGVRVASAMARVCKNDLGGDPGTGRRAQLWTSYIKVRLGCTDFTRFPEDSQKGNFFFDAIHASSWVPNLENGVLFGVFTTVTHGYPHSAVCAFRREDIEKAFNGTSFIEFSLSWDALSKVITANSSTYTGASTACVSDSRTLNPTETNFLLSHPLLAEPPKQRYDRAFYTQPGVAFRAVAAFVFNEAWGSWVICYAATANGLVVKLAEKIVAGGTTSAGAQRVDSFNVPKGGIHKLLVSMEHRSLYVFSDDDVLQYRVDDCEGRPVDCASCLMDPFCGWDGARCLPHVSGTTRRTC